MKRAVLGLLLSVTTMVVIGIVMLFSTGAFSRDAYKVKKHKHEAVAGAKPSAEKASGDAGENEILWDPACLVKRQAMWLGIGLCVCLGAALLDYNFWQKTWAYWFGLAVILLLACYVFPKINGSHRWIRYGPISFQPSEIGKIAAIAFLASWFQNHIEDARELIKGIVLPLMGVGVLMGLIAGEVDLGTTAIIGGTALVMIFVAGANLFYLLPLPVIGISGILYAAWQIPERVKRLLAFLDLENHKEGGGYQQWNGLIAFGSGGVDGLGLGNGRQKFMFLPEAHTDFIFPTIGEELGLVFTLLIVFCYVVMIISGMAIALNARDRFGMLMGTGITTMLALHAAMNIGVTTAVLPNKGIPLPFISYGGSNLLFSLLGIGILLNIYRKGDSKPPVRSVTKPRPLMTPRI
jgi:cell division protein FtsW